MAEPILPTIPNDLPRATRVVMRYRIVRIGVRDDSQTPPQRLRFAPALRPPRPVSLHAFSYFAGGFFLNWNGRKRGSVGLHLRRVKLGLTMRRPRYYFTLFDRPWPRMICTLLASQISRTKSRRRMARRPFRMGFLYFVVHTRWYLRSKTVWGPARYSCMCAL